MWFPIRSAIAHGRTPEQLAKLEAMTEMEFRDYVGMMPEMDEDILVIDDLSHHETETPAGDLQAGYFLRRYQGEVWGAEDGNSLQATA